MNWTYNSPTHASTAWARIPLLVINTLQIHQIWIFLIFEPENTLTEPAQYYKHKYIFKFVFEVSPACSAVFRDWGYKFSQMSHDAATKTVKVFLFSNIVCKKNYTNEINRIFAIAKTKAEDNINIISYWIPPIKKIKMNDKKKHLRRCFRIAVHAYKHFYYNNKRWTIFLKWKSRGTEKRNQVIVWLLWSRNIIFVSYNICSYGICW